MIPKGASMNGISITLAAALALGAAAHAARFEFGILGDAPYTALEEQRFRKLVQAMNGAEPAFVVHVGDLHADARGAGPTPCTDEALAGSKALLETIAHPVVVTPGDNDWTDCHGGEPPVEPLARLEALRRVLFAEDRTLGRRQLAVSRQSGDAAHVAFRENARWVHGDVVFATVHMVGSNNNLGRGAEADAEHARRDAANIEWMKQAFELAERGKHKAVVLLTQANPYFEDRWPRSRRSLMRLAQPPAAGSGFRAFLAALELEVAAWRRPVLFVHGDTHYFRVDKPLFDPASGRAFEGFTRVETFGSPYVGWVRIVVDTARPGMFEFRPEMVTE